MKRSLCFTAVVASLVAAGTLAAQNAPIAYARSFCIKVLPGKDAEYSKYMSEVSKPIQQVRADAG